MLDARRTIINFDEAKQAVSENKSEPAPEPIDRAVEIERLAALDPVAYEVARNDAAKLLGMRASILDKVVAAKRRELGLKTETVDDGQGRTVSIDDVLPWHEPVDGDFLATALSAVIRAYAVVPDYAADTIALWIFHTWLVHRFSISPRLAVTSPTKGCGKTTILRLLKRLAKRAKRAGSISPPALFRAIEQFGPTILLDETEKYVVHGSDLHALLNDGHSKGAAVWRVLGDKLELREFAIYGAVAFARNGKMPDDLEQRSIIITMQRRLRDEHVMELRDDRCHQLDELARKCSRWADDHSDVVGDIDPDMGGLINRVADNWRPLFAIADTIGSDWPERVRSAAAALMPGEADSSGTLLLSDIRPVFDERKLDRIFSEDLAHALASIEGGRWARQG
jgi:putative DNA primase/helicase